MKHRVSVIVPTHKRKNRLKTTINSILNQTYKNIEIVLINERNY